MLVNVLLVFNQSEFKPKDIFRAASLPLLAVSNSHVKKDQPKIEAGQKISPLLLVQDSANEKVVIADGYHTSSNTMAASNIQGIGAHNFSTALRAGCSDVSGMELGPDFFKRRRASSLVRPSEESLAAVITAAGAGSGGASGIKVHITGAAATSP